MLHTIAHPHIFKVKTLDKLPHYRAQGHKILVGVGLTKFNTFFISGVDPWSGPYYGALLVSTFELKTISCPLNVPFWDMEKKKTQKGKHTKLREEKQSLHNKRCFVVFLVSFLLNGIRSSSHILPTKWFP